MRVTYEGLLKNGSDEDVELARRELETISRLEVEAVCLGHNRAVSAESSVHYRAAERLLRWSLVVIVAAWVVAGLALVAIVAALVAPDSLRTPAVVTLCVAVPAFLASGLSMRYCDRLLARLRAHVERTNELLAQRIPLDR
jgi:hypothetical protein